jgi:hypothetical protein
MAEELQEIIGSEAYLDSGDAWTADSVIGSGNCCSVVRFKRLSTCCRRGARNSALSRVRASLGDKITVHHNPARRGLVWATL